MSEDQSTPMTDTERQELREAAERATPGPWHMSGGRCDLYDGNRPVNGHTISLSRDSAKEEIAVAHVFYDKRTGEGFSDAKFIALANPAAILSLLDERDALSEQAERLTWQVRDTCARAERAEFLLALVAAVASENDRKGAALCESCGLDWCGASCGRWPSGSVDA